MCVNYGLWLLAESCGLSSPTKTAWNDTVCAGVCASVCVHAWFVFSVHVCVTHKVLSLGMWLKLDTGMPLMLLLFSVLQNIKTIKPPGAPHLGSHSLILRSKVAKHMSPFSVTFYFLSFQ